MTELFVMSACVRMKGVWRGGEGGRRDINPYILFFSLTSFQAESLPGEKGEVWRERTTERTEGWEGKKTTTRGDETTHHLCVCV